MNATNAADTGAGETFPSIWRRLAAMVYEAFLLFAMFVPTLVVMLLLGALFGADKQRFSGWVGSLFALLPVLVWGVYFVWCWQRGGRTLAMKAWRLRLHAADGSPPGRGRCIARYVLALFAFGSAGVGLLMLRNHANELRYWALLAPLAISMLWALVDRERQFLYDRVAGTKMVLEPKPKVESRESRVES